MKMIIQLSEAEEAKAVTHAIASFHRHSVAESHLRGG